MSKHIHTDYYQDALEKRYCYGCLKQFIVGEEIAAYVCKILCPYCGSPKNEAVAWVDDDDTLDALGCGGLYFHKSKHAEITEYFDRCIYCHEKLAPGSVSIEGICTKCKSADLFKDFNELIPALPVKGE